MESIVAIVGRPNVGKSTLFNRLTKSKEAIVYNEPGITRDRQYGACDWNGLEFEVIDTGGYLPATKDLFVSSIAHQVFCAINEADLIIFLLDVNAGITQTDLTIAEILRKQNKKVIVVANKVDSVKQMNLSADFYKLGLGDVFEIAAINGSGTGELLDQVVVFLRKKTNNLTPSTPSPNEHQDKLKLAIVGRPNVGKSTLLNTFVSQDRVIVSDMAGTTRDTIEVPFKKFGYDLIFLDTAGLRKRAKVEDDIEFYSTLRSIKGVQRADVCFLVVDAHELIKAQDLKIFSLIHKHNKGVVILVNKWDLAPELRLTKNAVKKEIIEKIAPFNDVPVLFVSAQNKEKLLNALDMALKVYENKTKKIPTSILNKTMLEIIECYPPPQVRGTSVKIKYITQIPSTIPTFILFSNKPENIKENYKRFLENKLRENFNFSGVPIRLFFRNK